MATTHLSLVTPAALKFEGEVELVIAPGAAGDLAALVNHAPLLTTLRTGLVKADTIGPSAGDAKPAVERVEFCVDRHPHHKSHRSRPCRDEAAGQTHLCAYCVRLLVFAAGG